MEDDLLLPAWLLQHRNKNSVFWALRGILFDLLSWSILYSRGGLVHLVQIPQSTSATCILHCMNQTQFFGAKIHLPAAHATPLGCLQSLHWRICSLVKEEKVVKTSFVASATTVLAAIIHWSHGGILLIHNHLFPSAVLLPLHLLATVWSISTEEYLKTELATEGLKKGTCCFRDCSAVSITMRCGRSISVGQFLIQTH